MICKIPVYIRQMKNISKQMLRQLILLSMLIAPAMAGLCAPGYKYDSGSSACAVVTCENHQFVNSTHHCQNCGLGTYTDLFYGTAAAPGSDLVKAAWDYNFWNQALMCGVRACKVDHRVSSATEADGGGQCVRCNEWETRPAGDNTFINRVSGTDCAPKNCTSDQFVADDVNHTCVNCPSQRVQTIFVNRSVPTECAECAPAYFPNGTHCIQCPSGSTTGGNAKKADGSEFSSLVLDGSPDDAFLYCDFCHNGWYAAMEGGDNSTSKCYECPLGTSGKVISLPGQKTKFVDSFCEADPDAVHTSHPQYPQSYLDNQPQITGAQYVKDDHTIGNCPTGSVAFGSNESSWDAPYYAGPETQCTCLLTNGYEQEVIAGTGSCTVVYCLTGQKVENNLCVPCGRSDEGYVTSSIAGLPATGVDTFCGVCGPDLFFNYRDSVCEDAANANFNCEEDEYVNAEHKCTECTVGTYTFDPAINRNGTGDGSGTGKRTYSRQRFSPESQVCFPEICKEDYYVDGSTKKCVPCVAWLTIAAGENSNSSTYGQCTTRLCAADEKVLNDTDKTCAPCDTGYRQETQLQREDNKTWGRLCLQCDEDYYSSAVGTECLPCSTDSSPGYLSKDYNGANFPFRSSSQNALNLLSHNHTCSRCATNFHSAGSIVPNTNVWTPSRCERYDSTTGSLLEWVDSDGVYFRNASFGSANVQNQCPTGVPFCLKIGDSDLKNPPNAAPKPASVPGSCSSAQGGGTDYSWTYVQQECTSGASGSQPTTQTKEQCRGELFIYECYKCEFEKEAPGIKNRYQNSYCMMEYCPIPNTRVYDNECYDCDPTAAGFDPAAPGHVTGFDYSFGGHNRGGPNTFCGKVDLTGGITDSETRQTDAIKDSSDRAAAIKAATENTDSLDGLPHLTTTRTGKTLELEGRDTVTLTFDDYFDNVDFTQTLANPQISMLSKCSDGVINDTFTACTGLTLAIWTDAKCSFTNYTNETYCVSQNEVWTNDTCVKDGVITGDTAEPACSGTYNGNLYTADLDVLSDENGLLLKNSGRLRLCFRSDRKAIDCGKGWHCSTGHEHEITQTGCELSGGTWMTTPKGECLTYDSALKHTSAFIGEQSGENAAGNLDQWKRMVSVALCVEPDTTGQLKEQATRAQIGADLTFNVEEDKCHLMPPANGKITGSGFSDRCTADLLGIGEDCYTVCDEGYSLSGKSSCAFDSEADPPYKYYASGACTLDTEADSYGASTGKTQYGTNTEDGPYNTDDKKDSEVAKADGSGVISVDNVPTCRFLPPNAIFPDSLVNGVELHHDGSTSPEKQDFSQIGDNMAKIKINFNKDALSADAQVSYEYYLIAATNTFVASAMPSSTVRPLLMGDQLAVVTMDASEQSEQGGNFDMGRQTVVSNEDCYYDNATTTVQTCRPTASITYQKRYSVVIGASSKCAGPRFAGKNYVFIRGVYSVDSIFELKYAPGLQVGETGFNEIAPGIWVRNKVSSGDPTLMLHADYKKAMVSKAHASQTVTHAMLKAYTRLELLSGWEGTAGHRANGQPNVQGTQGVCRDALVTDTEYDQGYNETEGQNAAELVETAVREGAGCKFRARMAVYQTEDGISGNFKPSILSGYRAEVSMSQYAQFNFGMLKEGKISQLGQMSQKPENFGQVLSMPSIADQMDPQKPQFGADVRFDVCSCNKRFVYGEPTSMSGAPSKISEGKANECAYNDLLRASFNELLDGKARQVVVEDDTMVPTTLAHAMADSASIAFTGQSSYANAGGATYVAQFTGSGTDPVKDHEVGVAAACTYQAFFPPGIQTPFAYVRAWFKFSEATAVDQRNIDDDGKISRDITTGSGDDGVSTATDNEDSGTSLYPGRRLRQAAKIAPPNVQHSVHFKFGVA